MTSLQERVDNILSNMEKEYYPKDTFEILALVRNLQHSTHYFDGDSFSDVRDCIFNNCLERLEREDWRMNYE